MEDEEEVELLCEDCGAPYGSSFDSCPHCATKERTPHPSFTNQKMCSRCPFRKNSLKGWLGDYKPEEVIQVLQHEEHFYCHSEVNYNKRNWKDTLDGKPHCAGALQMTKAMCKIPRDREHGIAVKTIKIEKNCFTLPAEFIKHHTKKWVWDYKNSDK